MKVDYFLWVDIKNSEKRVKSFFTVDWALKAYFQGDFGGFLWKFGWIERKFRLFCIYVTIMIRNLMKIWEKNMGNSSNLKKNAFLWENFKIFNIKKNKLIKFL